MECSVDKVKDFFKDVLYFTEIAIINKIVKISVIELPVRVYIFVLRGSNRVNFGGH